MKYYLLSTSHLVTGIWFRNDEDFLTAMNYVAVAAAVTGVSILAFVLMSNHVHFVLCCSYKKALEFINHFKRLYGAYFQKKYGIRSLLRRNTVDIRELSRYDESLERGIAYTIDNPVAANLCMHPSQYPWGSGNTIFNRSEAQGRKLSELSQSKRRRLLKSKAELNPDSILGIGGFILPQSYIPVRFLESLFGTPKRLNFFITTSSKARLKLEKSPSPAFRNQVLTQAVQDLSRSLLKTGTIQELSSDDKRELLLQMQRRFNDDAKQLARVTGFSYEEVLQILG